MKDVTREWLEDADYDIQSADAMQKAGRYFYVVFMRHLAVEKMLKAVWLESRDDAPPRVHGLVYLYEKLHLKGRMPERLVALIDDLDDKSVVTRYPEGRKMIADRLDAKTAGEILQNTKDALTWITETIA